eukprot:66481-Prorocentrum_minimum.AAC.2
MCLRHKRITIGFPSASWRDRSTASVPLFFCGRRHDWKRHRPSDKPVASMAVAAGLLVEEC